MNVGEQQPVSTPGFVYLVGAGPGDPELLTVKAARLIQEAEVVVLDRLISDEILTLIPPGATCIYAGKAPEKHYFTQSEINDLLVRLGKSGRKIVRLKGGDPYVFGRGGEEALHLAAHGIPFEVVPGISAAGGCGAALGIPLTHRGMSTGVRYVTGHCRENGKLQLDWRGLSDPNTTLVIYMAVGTVQEITENLIKAGLPAATPAAAIERGTTPEQRQFLTTLGELPTLVESYHIRPPAMFIIGSVVRLSQVLRPDLMMENATIVSIEDRRKA
ncbi:MAG: uroporphyrinogen-III C-methyltransferase [Magnetospiraceae bacterium]